MRLVSTYDTTERYAREMYPGRINAASVPYMDYARMQVAKRVPINCSSDYVRTFKTNH